LEIEGEGAKSVTMRMVSTDGHRLSLCERSLEDNEGLLGGENVRQLIVPKKTLLELRKFIDVNEGIKIGIGEKQISFKGEDVFLTSRLIEGNYPNYRQVIPQKGEQTVRVNRTQFISVVRRVSVMSREKTRAIKIEFLPGKAILRANDPEIGEAREDIEVTYKGPGLAVGLNYQYVLDALESMDDEEIIIEMQSNLSPCVIKQESDPGSLCIVMPMRVQEAE
jgi:DNA polymerase-3 subunit beta